MDLTQKTVGEIPFSQKRVREYSAFSETSYYNEGKLKYDLFNQREYVDSLVLYQTVHVNLRIRGSSTNVYATVTRENRRNSMRVAKVQVRLYNGHIYWIREAQITKQKW